MPVLEEPHKRFVLRCLARYASAKETIGALAQEFPDADLSRMTAQNLTVYDPNTGAGRAWLSDEHRAYFLECRRAANAEEELIPIANRAYRLTRLQEIAEHEDHSGNPILVAKMLEQAAREMGGMYCATARAAPGGGISGGTSGAGTSEPERAEELNSVLDILRTRPTGEATPEGVPGRDARPGTPGEHPSEVRE